jgi:hypothetical protein
MLNHENASLDKSLAVTVSDNFVPYGSHVATIGRKSRKKGCAELDTAVFKGGGKG